MPYRGDVFSVLADATYAMDDRTDFQAAYSFSWADYGQHNFADGLPLGMRYEQHTLTAGVTRRLGKNISAKLQYGFYNFADPGGGGANNYTAHAVFGVLAVRIP